MFKRINIKIFVLLCIFLSFGILPTGAEDSSSSNYKLVGASFSSGSENSNGSDQKLFVSLGNTLNSDKSNSSLYSLKPGSPNVWIAHTPKVKCFETISDGSTSCSDSDIVPNGMVQVCGTGGCYDRARFEIDPQNNTSEVLYSVRMTTDASWSSWKYLDGSTFTLEDSISHDINDYLTKSDWESSNFNILGLKPNTKYYLKLSALKGDFTETNLSPGNNFATTGIPTVAFDLDIAPSTGNNTETTSPNGIRLGVLSPGIVTNSTDLIWIDLGTNASGGVKAYVKDQFAGLKSVVGSHVINSQTSDLSIAGEGYGLTKNTNVENSLGPLVINTPYDASGNNVGALSLTDKEILNSSSKPLNGGRASFWIKSKADLNTPSGSDYADNLTFSVIGSF